jgi:WD40 repeat protein
MLCLQITALDFTPDGKTLAVGSEDGVVALWDVAAARRLGSAQQHAGAVWALAASRGDGSLLASGEPWPWSSAADVAGTHSPAGQGV